ncbi:hypothetical protein ABZ541_05310 [Micromonospora sediminicola]|uniref:hypothetical protein n=1 Tax=Micromonospora sediminicola TaxID=946078 RepID=UPI0033DE81AB
MTRGTRNNAVLKLGGVGAVAVLLIGAGLQLASADENANAAPVSVVCPSVADKLGAVPVAAQVGVNRELQNLEKQIANVNERLAREPKAAQNQLNDIAGKRRAVLDRISQDITRVGGAAPVGLQGLANCALAGAGGGAEGGGVAAPPANAQTVNCPTVRDKLPEVPAAAVAGVEKELVNLDEEIARQNERLAKLAVKPEGGPNFVQNAILGPLRNKRVAVLNRIATDIGRVNGNRPDDLVDLATCTLNSPGTPSAVNGEGGQGEAAGSGTGGATQARTVNCPRVELPAVPAAAVGQVQSELATLDKQIDEANSRLARIAVNPEGGPNFIANAILNPLRSKRGAALDRIEIAFNRVGAQRPELNSLAACTLD